MGAGSHKHIIAFAWVRHSLHKKKKKCSDYTTVCLMETSVGRVSCDLGPKVGPAYGTVFEPFQVQMFVP